ncbi:hypothetical protein [Sulfurimonas sediminis]|nr:hypothetical protein [Sulfurimonas sediminis]
MLEDKERWNKIFYPQNPEYLLYENELLCALILSTMNKLVQLPW